MSSLNLSPRTFPAPEQLPPQSSHRGLDLSSFSRTTGILTFSVHLETPLGTRETPLLPTLYLKVRQTRLSHACLTCECRGPRAY